MNLEQISLKNTNGFVKIFKTIQSVYHLRSGSPFGMSFAIFVVDTKIWDCSQCLSDLRFRELKKHIEI